MQLVVTTVNKVLAFTIEDGCTLGTDTVAFVPSCTCLWCSHTAREWHMPLKSWQNQLKWLSCTGTIFVPALRTEVRNLMVDY